MAHAILVDELVRQGMSLVDALDKQEPWAAATVGMTDEERMVRRNQRAMRKWEARHRGG